MDAFVASHEFVVLLDDETDAPVVRGIKELHRPFAMDEGSIPCSKGREGGHYGTYEKCWVQRLRCQSLQQIW